MESRTSYEAALTAEQSDLLSLLLEGEEEGGVPLRRRAGGEEVPLSFAQKRLWFLDRMQPGAAVYNVPVCYRVSGALDVAALEQSLAAIVARHESLRTTFPSVDGEPRQRVERHRSFALQIHDLAHLSGAAREAEAMRLAAMEGEAPFDLEYGPLFRVRLLRLGANEHWLMLTLHHIISDGWSLGVFFEELAALYAAHVEGCAAALPELPVQFGDFAIWQREHVASIAEEQLAFWRGALAGVPPVLDLPADRARPAVQSFRGDRRTFRVPPEVAAALAALARRESATPFLVYLSAFQILLARLTRQQDFVVGCPMANRQRIETEGLIGFFANTLLFRGDLTGDPTFVELLARVRAFSAAAYEHQDLPFQQLIEALQPERDPSRVPYGDAAFSFQPLEHLALRGLTLTLVDVPRTTAKFDFTLWMLQSADGVTGEVEFRTDLFDGATIERIVDQFLVLLRGIAGDPSRRWSELTLVSDVERQRLLEQWQERDAPSYAQEDIVAAFEARVAAQPDAIAIADGDTTYTYAELNARANRLAHRLVREGVGGDRVVAVLLPRSADFVTAILAAVKAGGAYLPIDPQYPAERIAYMLEDSGAAVVISRETMIDAAWQSESDANPAVAVPLDSLFYLIYTSGSTGRPKGVMVPRRGAQNLVAWYRRRHALSANDHGAMIVGPAFDASVIETWPFLVSGASLHVASDDVRLQPTRLIEWFASNAITVAFPPTPLAETLLREQWPSDMPFRAMLTGGDKLHRGTWTSLPFDLVNHYGPTESSVLVTCGDVEAGGDRDPGIGRPIANAKVYILDEALQLVPAGTPGELCIGGAGLARGYAGSPALTAEAFVPNPFAAGERMYRTGDLARWLPSGELEFLGRLDDQVKIRGFRVELGEIESVLAASDGVREACVLAREDAPGEKRLVAYVTGDGLDVDALRAAAAARLPQFMVPSAIVVLPSMPMTRNGKIDRAALPAPSAAPRASAMAASDVERAIADIWSEVLKVEAVGLEDNFFDLGGHSLLLTQVHVKLRDRLGYTGSVVELFRHPTVKSLAEQIAPRQEAPQPRRSAEHAKPAEDNDVAIIGMSLRFPGARDEEQLWSNLREGVESVAFFTKEELAGVVDAELFDDPHYVPARAILGDVDLFDAAFFGISTREALVMDPQQRIFLEMSWEALESAGYDPEQYDGDIGVYAGSAISFYSFGAATGDRSVDDLPEFLEHDISALPTRVSYKLNLRGPSFFLSTGCSTSLVAVHLACRALLAGEANMALAGGISISLPEKIGYFTEQDAYFAPDGHCRTFDARAQGTVGGNGAGIVVLKRLSDAIRDGDTIRAVVKGTAINNDGSRKVGFTAPSIDGQKRCIVEAQRAAGVDPSTITLIEAHGTATPLGDPIEVAALREVFGEGAGPSSCALGSIKANLGHLNTAAGVAGLIKAVLALEHAEMPPMMHFERANPRLGLESSPFYVPSSATRWEARGGKRRAGVSSFGIGGTNAHAVLEEAPRVEAGSPSRAQQLLVVSARSADALEHATDRLAAHLRAHPEQPLADVAFTLARGRRAFAHRRAIVAGSHDAAADLLERRDPKKVATAVAGAKSPEIVFMFPGGGAQYAGMGRGLYESEAVYRESIDACAEILRVHLDGEDLRTLLFEANGGDAMRRTLIALPTLFATEYALAKLLMSWGVRPAAMIGHSLGEYVAATLAGVFSLEDALAVVALRGRLIERLPAGAMLHVPLAESEIASLLPSGVAIAAINSPTSCVVSGSAAAIESLEQIFAAREVECRRLPIIAPGHSQLIDPILDEFTRFVSGLRLREPSMPYLSNVTGRWIEPGQATDAGYWARHLRHTVRFADGMRELVAQPGRAYVEVGPGHTLTTLAREIGGAACALVTPTMRHAKHEQPDLAVALEVLGKLWTAGAAIDWSAFSAGEKRRRVPLPTYPFERRSYWIEAGVAFVPHATTGGAANAQTITAPTNARTLTAPADPPRNEKEAILARIFAEALALDAVGIHDNFFELGGTSVLGIQIVAKARKAGLRFTSKHIFEQQTVAGLAAVAESAGGANASTVATAGPLALTAVQRWFFEARPAEPHHFNLAERFVLRADADAAAVERALHAVVQQHESLRLRFREVDGEWQQEIVPYDELASATLLRRIAHVDELQSGFDLAAPPLLRAGWIQDDAGASLLLAVHHLAADARAWRVILEDLQTAYAQLAAGEAISLPPRTSSLRRWSDGLAAWVTSARAHAELAYWRDEVQQGAEPLPLDRAGGANDVASRRVVTLELSEDETRELTDGVARTHRMQPHEILTAAAARALGRWSGRARQRLDLEVDAREMLGGEDDFSRTAGWFTALYPLLLDGDDADAGALLRNVRERLRAVPSGGSGFAPLRQLSPDPATRALLAAAPAETLFVYLGRFDAVGAESPLFEPVRLDAGEEHGARNVRRHKLEIGAVILDGTLRVNVAYSENLHERASIERLANELRAALDAIRGVDAGASAAPRYAASDFPDAMISQDELDEILAAYENEELV